MEGDGEGQKKKEENNQGHECGARWSWTQDCKENLSVLFVWKGAREGEESDGSRDMNESVSILMQDCENKQRCFCLFAMGWRG